QQLYVAVIARAGQHLAVAYVVDAAVADVSPIRSAVLHQADRSRGARSGIDVLSSAQPGDLVVRTTQGHVQETEGIEQRRTGALKGIEQAFERGVGRPAAVGVPTHAVDHDHERSAVRLSDRDA